MGRKDRIRTEFGPAALDIGAGDVELIGGQAFGIFKNTNDFYVFSYGMAEDVGNDSRIVTPQSRKLF